MIRGIAVATIDVSSALIAALSRSPNVTMVSFARGRSIFGRSISSTVSFQPIEVPM